MLELQHAPILPGARQHGVMRGLVQRVSRAEVTVDGEVVGSIGPGLCVLVGVTHDDTDVHARKLAREALEPAGHGRRGRRDEPIRRRHHDGAARRQPVHPLRRYGQGPPAELDKRQRTHPGHAEPLVDAVVGHLRALGAEVATGRFAPRCQVSLVNDGPVTLLFDVARRDLRFRGHGTRSFQGRTLIALNVPAFPSNSVTQMLAPSNAMPRAPFPAGYRPRA